MSELNRIDVTDTAKLIRKDLGKMFPGVKFKVTSERGVNNAITAHWEDGPTKAEVQEVIDQYAGYRTYTSNGFDKKEMIVHYEGSQRIHYDADYLFTERGMSQGFVQRVIDEHFKGREDIDWDSLYFDDKGYLTGGYQTISDPEFGIERDSVRDVIYRKARSVGDHWPAVVTEPDDKQAAKFEGMADKLKGKIAEKRQRLDNTLTNTARRQRMYESSLKDVQRMEQVEDKLRALAQCWAVGDVPRELAGVKTKALVEQLVATEHSPSLHHRPAIWKAAMKAGISQQQQYEAAHKTLMDLGDPDAGQETEADRLARIEREIMLTNIPGFFPTPDEIVEKMLTMTLGDRLQDGAGRILEPSAGKGNIADMARTWYPEATLDVVEWNYNLRKILEQKGHNVIGDDCLELTPDDGLYDLVVMNPPFENGQDMEHVQHCFTLLKPGGRLVSIISESCFFRKDGKYQEWRDWFDDEGGRDIDLPAGAFKDSERSTGVKVRIIVMDAPEVATSIAVDPAHDELLDNSDLALLHYIWLRQDEDEEQFADLGDQSRYVRAADFLMERGYLDDDAADEPLYRLTDVGHQALKQRGDLHKGMFVRNKKLNKTGWLEKHGKRGWKVKVYTALEKGYNDTWREADLTPFPRPPMKDLIRNYKAAKKQGNEIGLRVTHHLIRLGYIKAGILPVSERRTIVEAAYTRRDEAHEEPDGTSPYMIENQMGITPDEDWLLVSWARRWYKERPPIKVQPKANPFQGSGRSPLYTQYMQIKELYPNEFVLFQVGDFYEIFGDDAQQAADLLDIMVTSRSISKRGDKVQMAGFPVKTADTYIAKLVDLGYSVAVAEYANEPTRIISNGQRQREVTDVHLGGSPSSVTLPETPEYEPERAFLSGQYVKNTFTDKPLYGWLHKSKLLDDGQEAWVVFVHDHRIWTATWAEGRFELADRPDARVLLQELQTAKNKRRISSTLQDSLKSVLQLCYADDVAFGACLDVLNGESDMLLTVKQDRQTHDKPEPVQLEMF